MRWNSSLQRRFGFVFKSTRPNTISRLLGCSILVLAGASVAAGCQSQANLKTSSIPVRIANGKILTALDGNTLVMRNRGDRIFISSDSDTLLRRVEGRNLLRRLIGNEISREGVFAAVDPAGQQLAGLAALSVDARKKVASVVLLQTFQGDDRLVDLAARPRLYMSISVSGLDEHASCLATPWIDSRTASSEANFRSESCSIVKGHSLPGIKLEQL